MSLFRNCCTDSELEFKLPQLELKHTSGDKCTPFCVYTLCRVFFKFGLVSFKMANKKWRCIFFISKKKIGKMAFANLNWLIKQIWLIFPKAMKRSQSNPHNTKLLKPLPKAYC